MKMNNVFVKIEGFDEAIIGFDNNLCKYIYSVDRILEMLMKDGMSYEESNDYFYEYINKKCTGVLSPIMMNVI